MAGLHCEEPHPTIQTEGFRSPIVLIQIISSGLNRDWDENSLDVHIYIVYCIYIYKLGMTWNGWVVMSYVLNHCGGLEEVIGFLDLWNLRRPPGRTTIPDTPWDCHRTAAPLTNKKPPLAVSRQSRLAVPCVVFGYDYDYDSIIIQCLYQSR